MGNTSSYGWNYPTVGADEDAWGDELNTLAQDIDTQMAKGGRQLLSSGTASAAGSIEVTIPATTVPGGSVAWRQFELQVIEIEPVSNSVTLQATLAFDGVPTYQSADYRYSGAGTINGVASQFNSISASSIVLHGGVFVSAGGLGPSLSMKISTPVGGGHYSCLDWTVGFVDATASRDALFAGRGRCAALGDRLTRVKLAFSSGNISSARWALYGLPGL